MKSKNKIIADNLTADDKVLFVLQNNHKSYDRDFYAVFSGNNPSKVLVFNDQEIWNEFFIDNENDLINKLNNYDEIVINFIISMTFIEGDFESYEKYRQIALERKDSFNYPQERIWILKYRIQTLFFKYINYLESSDDLQSSFILNALNYPLVQLILVTHNVTPASPKVWLSQLKNAVDDAEFGLISDLIRQKITPDQLQSLYNKYVGIIEDNLLLKTKNALTFIS